MKKPSSILDRARSATASLKTSREGDAGNESLPPITPLGEYHLRGGSSVAAKKAKDDSDMEYDGVEGEVEYEYYEDYEDDNDNEEYYYADEYYEEGEEEENDDGYIYLPGNLDSEEMIERPSTQKTKKSHFLRSLRPGTSKATLSITGALPAAIPGMVKNLPNALSATFGKVSNNLSTRIALSNLPDSLKEMNIMESATAGPLALISIVLIAALARSVMTSNNIFTTSRGRKIGKKKKKKQNKGKKTDNLGLLKDRLLFWTGKKTLDEKVVENMEADSKLDEGTFPGEDDDDNTIMDLDLEDQGANMKTKQSSSLTKKRLSNTFLVPTAKVQNMWIWICALKGRVPSLRFEPTSTTASSPLKVATVMAKEKTEAPAKAERDALQQQLDSLEDSHDSLEQEYEASLRMLHEARIQLRKLQSEQTTSTTTTATSDAQNQQQMEAVVKKLEAKYRAQMKEQIERIRTQMEDKLRSSMEEELTKKITVQLQEEMKAEQSELETRLQQRLAQSKRELESDFQNAVDEAVSQELNRTLDSAVETAIQTERAKSQAELQRVKRGIKIILERERSQMKRQVQQATEQVREWMAKKQREELLMRAKVLKKEADSIINVGQQPPRGVEARQQRQQQQQGTSARRTVGGNDERVGRNGTGTSSSSSRTNSSYGR